MPHRALLNYSIGISQTALQAGFNRTASRLQFLQQGISAIFRFVQLIWTWAVEQISSLTNVPWHNWPLGLSPLNGEGRPAFRAAVDSAHGSRGGDAEVLVAVNSFFLKLKYGRDQPTTFFPEESVRVTGSRPAPFLPIFAAAKAEPPRCERPRRHLGCSEGHLAQSAELKTQMISAPGFFFDLHNRNCRRGACQAALQPTRLGLRAAKLPEFSKARLIIAQGPFAVIRCGRSILRLHMT